jgi:hypothetical protein
LKYFFYILIPLLVCFNVTTFGQFTVSPLRSDPNRQNSVNTQGFRLSAASAVQAVPNVKDTLKLPFFEDFTDLDPPIDTIFVDSVLYPTGIIRINTFGLHGLNNGDKIYLSGGRFDTIPSTPKFVGDQLLNGTWFAKRINPYSFSLYRDAGLTIPLVNTPSGGGNPKEIPRGENPIWVKDQAKISPTPDSLKWVQGGGAYINNRYCINPPSYNVASFDGLNANGKAYKNSDVYVTGNADTLTSLPIDLSPVQASDSLVLSFFYQRGGLGEVPDSVDGLFLQLKNSSNTWNTVWSRNGTSKSDTFNQSFISITDPLYFFKGFQFRFISQGELEGAFDVWNVDYIYLDTARNTTIQWHNDAAIQKAPVSLLKTYTSMPFQQFFFDGNNNDLIDTLSLTFINLKNDAYAYDPDSARLIFGNSTKSFPYIKTLSSSGFVEFESFEQKLIQFKVDHPFITKPNNQNYLKLNYSAGLLSLRQNDEEENTINHHGEHYGNDTISGYTILKDYYAYDDSSAEWSIAINQNSGKVAVEFDLNIQDTLVALDIYFPHIEVDLTTPVPTALDLIAWDQLMPLENELGRTAVTLKYTSGNNQFTRYTLQNELIVNNKLYVGYQQGINKEVPIGFDKNTDARGKMFYSVNGQWALTTEQGSIMIRPVFRNGGVVAGLFNPVHPNQPKAMLDCEVFPNPTTGTLNILGDIKEATLTDLSGRILLEQTFTAQDVNKTMELHNIPAGFYLLLLSNDKASTVKKIILAR